MYFPLSSRPHVAMYWMVWHGHNAEICVVAVFGTKGKLFVKVFDSWTMINPCIELKVIGTTEDGETFGFRDVAKKMLV